MKEAILSLKDVVYSLPGIGITIVCWGVYGSVLHNGQMAMGNSRLKPLICVGLAYFVLAILIPAAILISRGEFGGDWKLTGISWSMAAGVAGAMGALGIILALTAGGKPTYVMPLVFGCAPVVNVFATMVLTRTPWKSFHPVFLAGIFMVCLGAALVLIFKPAATHAPKSPPAAGKSSPEHARKPPAMSKDDSPMRQS
jgi:hypothetical protein